MGEAPSELQTQNLNETQIEGYAAQKVPQNKGPASPDFNNRVNTGNHLRSSSMSELHLLATFENDNEPAKDRKFLRKQNDEPADSNRDGVINTPLLGVMPKTNDKEF